MLVLHFISSLLLNALLSAAHFTGFHIYYHKHPQGFLIMYLFFGIFVFLCIVCMIFFFWRRKRLIRKICKMNPCEKKELLDSLMNPFGFACCPKQNMITSCIDAWQRSFGYSALFDQSASHFNMVFDCEPVYFNYNGRTWLIEFWKGQYGICTGAEIGVYRADTLLDTQQLSHTLFESIPNTLLLPMSMELCYKGRRLFYTEQAHWWLTGFCPGIYAFPEDLTLNVSITCLDREMLDSFTTALLRMGYNRYAVEVCNLTVSITFSAPHSAQPRRFHCISARFSQWQNRIFCSIFRRLTHPFTNISDQILYLYFFLPAAFRHMLRMKRHKKQKFCKNHHRKCRKCKRNHCFRRQK